MQRFQKIGVVGIGSMGQAMIKAIIASKIAAPSTIYIYNPNPLQLNQLKEHNINISANSSDLFHKSDIIIIAVKPTHIKDVLNEIASDEAFIKGGYEKKLIISIAAGITIKKIESVLYKDSIAPNLSIIRAMPNTPAMVLSGITGISPNKCVKEDDIKAAKALFGAMGDVIEFEEEDLNAVTALSGSGPAYVFYLAESMIEAGIELGLQPIDAVKLTISTIKGAAKLMDASNVSVEKLRENVTSPNGTTEAAIKTFNNYRVKQNIIEAIIAASDRAKELSESLD